MTLREKRMDNHILKTKVRHLKMFERWLLVYKLEKNTEEWLKKNIVELKEEIKLIKEK